MRVLIINTSERIGGAAVAANRLMKALIDNGIKAKMLVRDKQTDDVCVIPTEHPWLMSVRFLWERGVIWLYNRFSRVNLFAVDIANVGADITSLPEFKQADVIHLHWFNHAMLSLGDLRKILDSGKPVVWTMHDMWPCTGICHHARECDNYFTECHHCQYLVNGGGASDLSTRVFRKKKAIYSDHPIHFVTCSEWLKGRASQSGLLTGQQITAIPNPLNVRLYHPRDKVETRRKLALPIDKKLILFGAQKITDKRKGIDYLVDACRLLDTQHPDWKQHVAVMVLGTASEQLSGALPFEVFPLNYVSDENKLVDIYSAADIFVTPSLEENLPNTIMEAMACGTPCVGFQVGGIPEMIDHLHNGYVAHYKDVADFANGIEWTLDDENYQLLSEQAVRKVEMSYSEQAVAMRYIKVYNQLLGRENA